MTKQVLKKQFDLQINKAVEALKTYNPDKIILYGSVARGDFNENSDIDLLIIKKGVDKIRPHLRIYQVLKLLQDSSRVEPKVYTPQELAFRIKYHDWHLDEAVEQGKILYEK